MQVYGVHTGEGTPYEGVRVALMKWAEENRRYEFTPAGSVDGPLITWTPEKQAGAAGPFDTGHDVKPIDQATILVTSIPTGEDEYTTPAFPVPHERDLNDYILVFPADAGMEPIYVYLSEGNGYDPTKSREENARKPNIAQELTDQQKVELSGSGPEDEESARDNENNFDRFKKDDLVSSANEPINEQGLSAAARAWEKHAGRSDGVFEPLKGNLAQKNEAANQFVNEVLNNVNTVKTDLSRGGVEYRLPDGRGIRYNSDGSLSGFLDPKRPQ